MAKEIIFDHVNKWYGEDCIALENVSFSIEKGEFVFVIGKSGAGKSTLLKMLSRQISPDSGKIWIQGEEISSMTKSRIPALRRKIGQMQPEYGLLAHKNIY